MRAVEDLQRLVDAGDVEGVLAFLRGAPEKERKALAPAARDWLGRYDRMAAILAQVGGAAVRRFGPPMRALDAERYAWVRTDVRDAARVAWFATAGWGEVKNLHVYCAPRPPGALAILVDRRPAWLGKWADLVCAEGARMGGFFEVLRRLERDGIVPRIESDAYLSGLASTRSDPQRLRELLLSDPELLEDHVWRMLADAPAVASIAPVYQPVERPPLEPWSETLSALSAEGRLDRGRLLDAAIDALVTAPPPATAWLRTLYGRLELSDGERRSRAERYLRLLDSRTPDVLDFAFEVLGSLAAEGALPARDLADGLAPALSARTKATALRALALVEAIARTRPHEIAPLARAVTHAFEHPRPDVHLAACRVLAKLGPPTDASFLDALRERLGTVSATSRAQVESWLGAAPAAASPAQEDPVESVEQLTARAERLPAWARDLAGVDAALAAIRDGGPPPPALALDPLAVPRLRDPIEVPVDLEQIVDLLLGLLEGRGTGVDVERALAGLGGFSSVRPDGFDDLTGPLDARAAERLSKPSMSAPLLGQPEADLALAVLAWTRRGRALEALASMESVTSRLPWLEPTAGSFLSRRVVEIVRLLADGAPVDALAVPTHASGFLDPRELVRRALRTSGTGPLDAIQALLRLAPDFRRDALAEARGVGGELGAALRHALGGDGETIGSTRGLWVAAARARHPAGDDLAVEARHPGLGPDGALVARLEAKATSARGMGAARVLSVIYRPDAPRPRDFDLPTVSRHYEWELFAPTPLAASWRNTLWPLGPEALFAELAAQTSVSRESVGTYWIGDAGPALDVDANAGPMLRLFIAVALGARHPNSSRLAEDALLAAVEDGRLDGRGLGEALQIVLLSGTAPLSRWARVLRDAARVSALHRHVLRDALGHALGGQETPTLPLVELLNEWCAEDGVAVTDSPLRARLGRFRSGKSARLARELLERTTAPGALRAAAREALGGRVARAERWARGPTREERG